MISAFIVGLVLGAAATLLICIGLLKKNPVVVPVGESERVVVNENTVRQEEKEDARDLIGLVEDFKREQKANFETLQKLTDDLPQNSETLKQSIEVEYDEAKFI